MKTALLLMILISASLCVLHSPLTQKKPVKPVAKSGAIDLNTALLEGKPGTVSLYLSKGGNPNALIGGQTLLTIASNNGCIDTMKVLIKAGAKVNMAGKDGDTPLLRAARHLYRTELDTIDLLIKNGADVNLAFPKGSSPLMMVASPPSSTYESTYADGTKLLLKHGAKVNARNQMGYTALKLAKNAGANKIVAILKAAGAK
ncbi:MAG: ankyrin repeat domain-containing protein [Chthonomonadales bacterium]